MADCASCRHPCGSPGKDWFRPGGIRYCRVQVLWYLENADAIRDGIWPPDPHGTGYTDPALGSQSVRRPRLEAEHLAAEIDSRLKMLPHVIKDLLEVEVEREQPFDLWRGDAKIALYFLSGFKRPIAFCPDCNGVTLLEVRGNDWIQKCEDCKKTWGHLSFVTWRKQRKFREKEREMHICEHCGGYRWKTKVKGKVWTCRKCGFEKRQDES